MFEVRHRYAAYRDGRQIGPWAEGDRVDIDDADAEWVNRDSPGCLLAASAGPEPAAPADEPARQKPAGRDRQHRSGANRGS